MRHFFFPLSLKIIQTILSLLRLRGTSVNSGSKATSQFILRRTMPCSTQPQNCVLSYVTVGVETKLCQMVHPGEPNTMIRTAATRYQGMIAHGWWSERRCTIQCPANTIPVRSRATIRLPRLGDFSGSLCQFFPCDPKERAWNTQSLTRMSSRGKGVWNHLAACGDLALGRRASLLPIA